MPIERALVFNDVHIPFSCQPAVKLMLGAGKLAKPDIVIINGDLLDCWQISRYVKHPKLHGKANIVAEISEGREFLIRLRKAFPKQRIIYVFGNHEYRWDVFIASQARELYGLRGMTLGEQLECDQLKIELVDRGTRENYFQWGSLYIGHFDRVNKHSGYTAKNLLEDKGISGIQAHTHRGGSSFKRAYDRDMAFWENFCLCDRNPEYVNRPNWQLGFSVVYRDTASDFFHVEPHPIVETAHGSHYKYKTFMGGVILEERARRAA